MTPAEFTAACETLGLVTTPAKAAFFEVDKRTVQKWMAGKAGVPGPVRVLLRVMLRPSGS